MTNVFGDDLLASLRLGAEGDLLQSWPRHALYSSQSSSVNRAAKGALRRSLTGEALSIGDRLAGSFHPGSVSAVASRLVNWPIGR